MSTTHTTDEAVEVEQRQNKQAECKGNQLGGLAA
jgi:hypothetical protein